MSSNHSRRSRVSPPHDDSPHEPRQRAVQKAVQCIPEEFTPAWGERWSPAPPRRKSDKTPMNRTVPVFLSEFKLDLPPPLLTPDGRGPIIPRVVRSHVGKPTKRKNRKTRKRASYLTSSHQQSQSPSTRQSTGELGADIPTSELFSAPLQAESVSTDSALYASHVYPISQLYDGRNQLVLTYNNYQHEVSADNLTQYGSQMPHVLPYNGMGTAFPQTFFPPFPDGGWTPENGADVNQCYTDAMGCGSFLIQSDPSFHS